MCILDILRPRANYSASVANATIDLLLLSAWSMALESIDGQPIPVGSVVACSSDLRPEHLQFYYFARDDRVFRAFADRTEMHRSAIHRNLSRRLKWQLRLLGQVLEGRNTTYRVGALFSNKVAADHSVGKSRTVGQ